MCDHCEAVNKKHRITSPNDFKKTVRVVKDYLIDGTIVESGYWPKGTMKICDTPFSQVTGKGVYTEDIYIYYFECPICHQVFELSCETYHGAGGSWNPVNEKISNQ